jgi:glucose-6-phosphate isomerase
VSQELLEPFTIEMDLKGGGLRPTHQVIERRMSDMKEMYLQDPGGKDEVIYRVFGIRAPQTSSNLICSTTVLEPGTVGREYHMTKGHFHEVRDRAEVYVGLSGEGLLVLATEDGRYVTQPQKRGCVNYIPGGWAHRSVNTGQEPLVFFAAYIADAGHDYKTIEKTGFPVAVVSGRAGPEVVENPRFRS